VLVTDFTLPELGENISSGDVLRVLVKPGDTIQKEQSVLELETDKATIEVPSSVAGQVKEVKVKAGDKVKVGQAILSVEDGAGAKSTEAAPTKSGGEGGKAEAPTKAEGGKADGDRRATAADAAPAPQPAKEKIPDVQPDIQARNQSTTPDKAGVKDPSVGPQAQSGAAEGDAPSRGRNVVDISRGARAPEASAPSAAAPELPPAPAAPSVRRMARELGVDINQVVGTSAGGRISTEDVKAYAKRLVEGGSRGGAVQAEPLPDFSRFGAVERQPMRAVRRKTAEHLSAAWATIPHVTQCDLADITGLEELRKKYAKQVEAAGGNLTVTSIAVKIVAAALKVFPQFNASIDMAREELIYKKYCHVGVAVDTDRGLLVPVIRDVDKKNIVQLAAELAQAAERARNKKTTLEEMEGGCFTITNLGGIGGTYFTPIVNHPEVAILGMSRAQMEPVYVNGTFEPRLMLPLSLSYDHRVIDGADGIRFLRFLVEALEQPFVLSLQG
jgi:pyruvate dehydrogenase E2 component (dihydrolipoyllysine-residue acetyltransferase)